MTELSVLTLVVLVGAAIDLTTTKYLMAAGMGAASAKAAASAFGLAFNFAGRRLLVFPEKPNPEWNPQNPD